MNLTDGAVSVPTLTPAARRYLRLLLAVIRPHKNLLDRRFRAVLRKKYEARAVRGLLAITPVAAAQLRTFAAFIEQVEYSGRRLAKLNVSPDEVSEALDAFDRLLEPILAGACEPAREQLRLATQFALGQAYYQVRESETQAFFGLYRAEAEAANLDDLLERFVRVLTTTFRAASGRLLPDGSGRGGKLSRPLYIGHGQRSEKLIADEGMRGRYASYWSFPLRDSGLMQFAFDVPYPWLPRELTLLEAAANRCSDAIERVRLREEVRRLELQARQAESEERRRIGRDLHDEAGQSLLLMRLKLELLERQVPEEMRPGLAEVREIAQQTVVELRRIIAALSPVLLERLGLKQALQQLITRLRKLHGAEVAVRIGAIPEWIPRQMEEVIYRVAQESLQNVAKHSHASRVNFFLRSTDKSIRLGVRDNGNGRSPKLSGQKASTFGLTGMRERAALLGGTLAISSAPGKGFSVKLDLPLCPATELNG
jgi:signal transduction histidine kinase